ncbi:Proton-dependent oligopeptide transporter family [Cinnamomum micranthum f. kanehirae]|uniref:Proton-dependent oligopeptide transporter family n=1 Tax=Cinnamomum micranthum f. kanehirae TaxID=337451 RepID=A0A3S3NUJ5_9MAGN|nr:Proton-dependent oligopeptide transporter family [Cinnamomum micranthum f. kanehirae]
MEEALEKGIPIEREETRPLLDKVGLVGPYTEDGSVDIQGRPALRHQSGNWRASAIIMGAECFDSMAYYGISTNLVMFIGKILHEGNASAAASINTWIGTGYFTPFLGALIADSYWGRYKTITVSALIYLLGMIIVTLSASITFLKPPSCEEFSCPSANEAQKLVFFSGLYLVAFGSGGLKTSLLPMGADQFEDGNPIEMEKKGSFFNWFYFSVNVGALLSSTFIVWIEENVGWALGFGISTVFMTISIGSFLFGTPIYRLQKPNGSPLKRLLQVTIASFKNRSLEVPVNNSELYEAWDEKSSALGSRKLVHTDEFRFLDKAAIVSNSEIKDSDALSPWRLCTVTQVEELKILLRLLPIWLTSVVFFAAFTQLYTTFIEQGGMMDSRMGPFFVPPATLFAFEVVTVMLLALIYDSLIAPFGKWFKINKHGISELQRMGIGRLLIILSMAVAALVETKRLENSRGGKTMSIAWQLPQYFILGVSEVFNCIGQLEFFYNQAPDTMRTMCIAFSLLTISFGSYLSTLIITVVSFVTTRVGWTEWIPNNLNDGHLDYFFWALAGLSALNFVTYLGCAKSFKLKKIIVED